MINYKNIFQNFSLRLSTNVVSKLLGLITLPIISRAFGPEVFGSWNLLLTILGYISIPFTVGIVTYGIREVAKGNESEVAKVFSARLILCALSFILSILLFYFVFDVTREIFLGLVIGILYLISIAVNIEYYFIGKSNFKVPAVSQIIGQVFFVISVVLVIRSANDFIYLVICYSLYNLIASVILIFNYPGRKNLKLDLDFPNVKRKITDSYKIGISAIIENLSVSLPIVFVSVFLGNYSTGIFSASFKLISILLLGFNTILTVMAPNLVKLKDKTKKEIIHQVKLIALFFIGFGAFASVFCFFLGELVIELVYGYQYGESAELLKLFALIYLPLLPMGMLFNTILIYFEKDKQYLRTTIASFVVLLVSTPLLINKLSAEGAIYGMSLYMFVYAALSFYYVTREIRSRND